ncbi:TPA: GNAT family N-acetyltransferase, partial [Stenotrophomonas maltophilia]|nr:GNAT family N-acetyltransferase [Stenotrophomonas maltophilia]
MTPPDPSTTTLQIRDARPGDAAALIALDSVAAHDPRRA